MHSNRRVVAVANNAFRMPLKELWPAALNIAPMRPPAKSLIPSS